jgi:hypothetical protein
MLVAINIIGKTFLLYVNLLGKEPILYGNPRETYVYKKLLAIVCIKT